MSFLKAQRRKEGKDKFVEFLQYPLIYDLWFSYFVPVALNYPLLLMIFFNTALLLCYYCPAYHISICYGTPLQSQYNFTILQSVNERMKKYLSRLYNHTVPFAILTECVCVHGCVYVFQSLFVVPRSQRELPSVLLVRLVG